jgi:hypothetical protein
MPVHHGWIACPRCRGDLIVSASIVNTALPANATVQRSAPWPRSTAGFAVAFAITYLG